jgi:hypothetical protein
MGGSMYGLSQPTDFYLFTQQFRLVCYFILRIALFQMLQFCLT